MFDIEAAKKAGYSDSEIANFLAQKNSFDINGARASGYNDAEIISHLSNARPPAKSVDTYSVNPTDGMSTVDKLLAGVGKFVVDRWQGAKQVAQDIPDYLQPWSPEAARRIMDRQKQVDERQKLDKPLMDTTAGKVGYIGAGVASTLPLAAIPGANTYAGAAAIGGAYGATDPVGTDQSRMLNTAIGVGASMAGKYVGDKLATKAADIIQARQSAKALNAPRDAVLNASHEAGFVTPPSETRPTFVSNVLERWAGKASIAQQASLKNQQVTNRLVRETLGLPKDTPITPETLQPIKEAAWSVYDEVRNLGTITADKQYSRALTDILKRNNVLAKDFQGLTDTSISDLVTTLNKDTFGADSAVEAIKALREQAKSNLGPLAKAAEKSLGRAQVAAADALEGVLERNIQPNNSLSGLLNSFKAARVTLGKVGTVERALNETTGNVSAAKLAGELAKGKPMTGEMRKAAEFARAFPKYVQQNVNPVQGGSPLDTTAAIATSAATQNPSWMALAFGRPMARDVLFSSLYQNKMTNPNYSLLTPSLLGRIVDPGLLTQNAPQSLGVGGGLLLNYANQ